MVPVQKQITLMAVGWLMTGLLAFGLVAGRAEAAGGERLDRFLEVTGFDVALESMRIGAQDAPQMIGLEASDFGLHWSQTADDVFAPEQIKDDAKRMLGGAMSEEMLDHALAFYGSELGQRLVEIENEAHATEDDGSEAAHGEALVAEMEETGAKRLALLRRMNHAIDPQNVGVKAVLEVQIRFLLAASDAGVINRVDEATLRALMEEQTAEVDAELEKAGIASAAAIYEPFTDAELEAYAEALEHPLMGQVYELMNGVQYTLMADRYEALALKMGEIGPGEEL